MSEPMALNTPRRVAARLARPWLIGPLLFICILSGYLLSFNVDKPTHNADWYIRYQVACQIVEHNAVNIRPYHADGRTGPGLYGLKYSQYTLGQTTALIPLYMLGRLFAGVAHTNCDTTIAVPQVFLTAKTLDMILGALLGVLFYATASLLGYRRRAALALTLLLAFGTALWPDVLSNLEHTMESLFLLAATYAALRYTAARRKSALWVAAMGMAAGLVFVTRVAGLIALPAFAAYLLLLHRRWEPGAWRRPFLRDLAIYSLGVLPSILINAAFDAIRFGSPLQTGPYPDHSIGYLPWIGIPNLLISPGKGLVWYVPALFLLPFAARAFWRRFPLPTILFGIICGVYIGFYSTVVYWHGDPAWGPRYLYALLPYLILPLGELFRRWREFRLALRGVMVGVLALSFLVQFSAVTVSYWRHWHYIYGYHYAQVENHFWGQNLNNWWYPDQSPIVISLEGIYDITQKYVTHQQLLQHPADQRLSNPYESCIFTVYGQASICITDLDELKYAGNWNTFTVWWAHTYPWWNEQTVVTLALIVLGIFLSSGGALLALLTLAVPLERRYGLRSATSRPGSGGVLDGANGNGHGSGNGHVLPPEIAALPELIVAHPATAPPGRGGTLVAEVAARPVVVAPATAPAQRRVAGLAPLGVAVVVAAAIYGGIAGTAAATAPAKAPPLVHMVAMSSTVRDGSWAYQIQGITRLRALPGGGELPAEGHQYILVHLRLSNLLDRPSHIRQDFFALTDRDGLAYPLVRSAIVPAATLYHLMPVGTTVPARSTVDGVLVYLVRTGASHFEVLGPGIALVKIGA